TTRSSMSVSAERTGSEKPEGRFTGGAVLLIFASFCRHKSVNPRHGLALLSYAPRLCAIHFFNFSFFTQLIERMSHRRKWQLHLFLRPFDKSDNLSGAGRTRCNRT